MCLLKGKPASSSLQASFFPGSSLTIKNAPGISRLRFLFPIQNKDLQCFVSFGSICVLEWNDQLLEPFWNSLKYQNFEIGEQPQICS